VEYDSIASAAWLSVNPIVYDADPPPSQFWLIEPIPVTPALTLMPVAVLNMLFMLALPCPIPALALTLELKGPKSLAPAECESLILLM
jgi:hypothetical protein